MSKRIILSEDEDKDKDNDDTENYLNNESNKPKRKSNGNQSFTGKRIFLLCKFLSFF